MSDGRSAPEVRAPTMRDVAALAEVSLKTVSRVVNREPGVSPQLAARVSEAVRLLEYRQNLTARSLRRSDRKTSMVGVLLEDVANPFSSALHRSIEEVARERGILVIAGSSDRDPDREQAVLAALIARGVDGIIAVPAGANHAPLQHRHQRRTPVVYVDRPISSSTADTVTSDNRGGSRAGVAHLLAGGHRRIAFLGDARDIWTEAERHLGYLQALGAAGAAVAEALIRQDIRSIEQAAAVTHDLLAGPQPPTALFTGQNLLTIGAIRALQQRGLQHRMALVGFDDVLLADLLDPKVTVVAQDTAGLGRAAAALLFQRLDGDTGPAQHVVVPTRLLVRGSGEIGPPAR